MVEYQTIGDIIKAARTASGLTQESLADKVDLSPTYISQIERGNRAPSLRVFFMLVNLLNIDMGVFNTEEACSNDINKSAISCEIQKDLYEKNKCKFLKEIHEELSDITDRYFCPDRGKSDKQK